MTERLFFASWPEDAVREELARRLPAWTAGLDGRLQRPDQWHLTLEFIGPADAALKSRLIAAADRVPMPPCEVRFDRCEHWHKPHVVCLVASVVPAPLAGFVAQLRAAVAAAGAPTESRPWHPHVTLARTVRDAGEWSLIPPLVWPVRRYALVRSTSHPAGSRYEPLHWWNAAAEGG